MSKKSKLPKTVRNLTELANLIREEFQTPCDKMKIKNWQTRGAFPRFPCSGDNNSYVVEECFEWVRGFLKRNGRVRDSEAMELDRKADEARAQKKILEVEREQFSFDLEKGKYVEREIANRTIAGAAKAYHALVRKIIHAAMPTEAAIKIVKQIEDECERIANGESQRV